MKTRILRLNPTEVDLGKIRIIARTVFRDGVIIYPTDTFYGLGADCFSARAVQRIFRLKKRPSAKGLPVLISHLEMAREISSLIPAAFEGLASSFWPGPLTLILPAARHLPQELVGPDQKIGVRLPAVEWLRELVEEIGAPLTATSANISGENEIVSPERVIDLFNNRVELVVDGGEAPGGRPSTVIDLTSERPRLLRRGAIPEEKLRKYF